MTQHHVGRSYAGRRFVGCSKGYLLPGVWYSSFPIIGGCPEVRVACLEVHAGCLEFRSRVASGSVWVASRSHRGLPRGPIAGCLKVRAGCLEVLCAGRLEVPGNKL